MGEQITSGLTIWKKITWFIREHSETIDVAGDQIYIYIYIFIFIYLFIYLFILNVLVYRHENPSAALQ